MNRHLVVEQHVAATPAHVYAAWTSAEALARWWWPQLPDTTYDVDARAGGRYLIRSQAAGIGVRGEFLRLDPPHGLAMTWQWLSGEAAEPIPEEVRVSFAPVDGGTLVTVTHLLHTSVDTDEPQRQGWEYVLGRLAEDRAAA